MTHKIKKYKHLNIVNAINEINEINEINNNIGVKYNTIKPELICNINNTSNCNVCNDKKCFTI
jgi:hypothetical protein